MSAVDAARVTDTPIVADAADTAPFVLTGQRWLLPCTSPAMGTICSCSVAQQIVQIGGPANRHYQVTVRIRGVVELAPYNGGTSPAPTGWYVGGAIGNMVHNSYRLVVSSPPAYYFVNFAGMTTPSTVVALDYTATFPIDAGARVTFDADGQDLSQLVNADAGGRPLTIPNVTTTPSPYDGQFVQLDVLSAR
jgi:hypothetical protein